MRKSRYDYYMRVILKKNNYIWIMHGFYMKIREVQNDSYMVYAWNIPYIFYWIIMKQLEYVLILIKFIYYKKKYNKSIIKLCIFCYIILSCWFRSIVLDRVVDCCVGCFCFHFPFFLSVHIKPIVFENIAWSSPGLSLLLLLKFFSFF